MEESAKEGQTCLRSCLTALASVPFLTPPTKVARAVTLSECEGSLPCVVVGGEEILHFVQNDDVVLFSRLPTFVSGYFFAQFLAFFLARMA